MLHEGKEYFLLGKDCFVVVDYSLPTYGNSIVYKQGKPIKNFKGITLSVLCELLRRNHQKCAHEYLSYVWDEHKAKENVDITTRGDAHAVAKEINKIRDRCLSQDDRELVIEPGYTMHARQVPHYFKTYDPSHASLGYMERTIDLEHLISTAFATEKIHAIIGERGMGKTVLAQCFAEKTCASEKYEHIIFTRYKNDLKDTISQLPTYARLSEALDLFTEKVYLLKELAHIGKTLLIIDNYDTPSYAEELCAENDYYNELLNTGCDILLTSCMHLDGVEGLQTTQIEALPIEQLTKYFCEIKPIPNERMDTLRAFIKTQLKGNTYLVTMAAKLARKNGLDDVLSAFDSLSVGATRPIDDTKDGKKQRPASIYQHYCAFLKNHPLVTDSNYKKLLTNLALLSLDGLPYADFFHRAFQKHERQHMEILFADLIDHFLAFEDNNLIHLHPIVREYIIEHLMSDEGDITTYLHHAIEHLAFETYEQDLTDWINIGQAIHQVFQNKEDEFCLWEKACITAYLSSAYDIIAIKDIAYNYAIDALALLNQIYWDNLPEPRLLTLANCYSVSCYSILHRMTILSTEDWTLAYNAIWKAKEILQTLHSDLAAIELTKVHGNIGACYLKCKEYHKAKEWHELALTERQNLLSIRDNQENRLLLYTTYRCLGTDYFYLSREKDADTFQLLKQSYEYNLHSLEGYISVYGTQHLECTVGANRLIGTGLQLLLVAENDDQLKTWTGKSKNELIVYFESLLQNSVRFLATVGFAITSEINDCAHKLEQLSQQTTKERALVYEDMIQKLKEIPGFRKG